MLRLRSRPAVVLSALAILPIASACGSSGGSDGGGSSAKSTKPLRFSAVRDVTSGACPSDSTSAVDDREADTCLHLGKPEMTVTSAKSATVVSEPQLGVTIDLQPKDAGRLKSLTTTLSKRTSPQNELAVTVGSSTDRRLISAPEVRAPIAGGAMQVVGDFTKKSATQLVHDLGS